MSARIVLDIEEDREKPGNVNLGMYNQGTEDMTDMERLSVRTLQPLLANAIIESQKIQRCDAFVTDERGEYVERMPWERIEDTIKRVTSNDSKEVR